MEDIQVLIFPNNLQNNTLEGKNDIFRIFVENGKFYYFYKKIGWTFSGCHVAYLEAATWPQASRFKFGNFEVLKKLVMC